MAKILKYAGSGVVTMRVQANVDNIILVFESAKQESVSDYEIILINLDQEQWESR